MPSKGSKYLNLSLNESGEIIGGGPLPPTDERPDGRHQHWRFQWLQNFAQPGESPRMHLGSITKVRCAGMPEDAGGWAPFEDAEMWKEI